MLRTISLWVLRLITGQPAPQQNNLGGDATNVAHVEGNLNIYQFHQHQNVVERSASKGASLGPFKGNLTDAHREVIALRNHFPKEDWIRMLNWMERRYGVKMIKELWPDSLAAVKQHLEAELLRISRRP